MKESDIRNQEVLNKYLDIVKKDVEKLFDSKKFEAVECPTCGKSDCIREFDKSGFTYVTCNKCGTLYANPRPTQAQLDLFYSKSDSNQFWAEEFFMPFAEARREKIFAPRAREIADEFPQYSKGKIGDIGAGFGLFLEELGKIWKEAALYAIEPSVDMVKICQEKGLHVIPKMFEDLEKQDSDFDFLFSFELFEHLNNPKSFLEKANQSLKLGGGILITTLNGKGFDIQLLWDKHKNVNPPHHLNFANPYSMQILLERCGFEIDSLSTPGRLDWDIVENMIKSENVKLGRWWDTVCEGDESVKASLQKWIAENRYSSHMRVIAKKIRNIES